MAVAQWEQNQTGGAGGTIDADIGFIRAGVAAPDPYQAEGGQLRDEWDRSIREVETDPDAHACDILDRMDADARLLRNIISERRSIWGQIRGAIENNPIGRWSLRIFGGAAATTAVRAGMGALGAGGALAGAVAGAAGGGFFAWLRARDREESATTWMRELGIQGDDQNAHDRIEQMNAGQLYMILGVLRGAIMEGRVRGSQQSRLSMALKYRQIRNRIQVLQQESADLNETGNPVFDNVGTALREANNDFRAISASAGEQYRNVYEQIRQMKSRRALMSGLKGVAVGAAVGMGLGWLFDPSHFQGATQATATGGGASGGVDHIQQMLDAQQAAQADPNLAQNIADHNANLDLYNNVTDPNIMAPVPNDPHLQEVIRHLTELSSQGGDVGGMSNIDFTNFTQMMGSNPNIHDILTMAGQNNLDYMVQMSNGQPFANYLADHASTFMQMPPDVQHFVLSHPTFSEAIFNAGDTGFKLAWPTISPATSSLLGKIFAGLGLAAAGTGFTYAHIQQRRIDRDLSAANQTGWFAGQLREAGNAHSEQIRLRNERLRNEAVENLRNNRVRLPLRFVSTARANARGLGDNNAGRTYDITNIAEDGTVTFSDNNWDRNERANRRDPRHPNINVYRDLVDEQGQWRAGVVPLYPNGNEAQNYRNESVNRLQQFRERINNAELEFTAAFLGNPDRHYTVLPTRPDNRFMVSNINANQQIEFQTRPGETADQMPVVYLYNLLDAENNIPRTPVFRIIPGTAEQQPQGERERNIAAAKQRIQGARVRFDAAFLAGLTPPYDPAAVPTRTDGLFIVDNFRLNNALVFRPRPGETAASLPNININDLVTVNGELRDNDLITIDALASTNPDNRMRAEIGRSETEAAITGSDIEFTDAAFLTAHLPVGVTPHTDNRYTVERIIPGNPPTGGRIIFTPRRNEPAGNMPNVNINDIIDPATGRLLEPTPVTRRAGNPRAENTPEAFDASRYDFLRAAPIQGRFMRRAGAGGRAENYFEINVATLTAAAQLQLQAAFNMTALPATHEIFIGDNQALAGLNMLPMEANIVGITDAGGGRPRFEVNLFMVMGTGRFAPENFYPAGLAANQMRPKEHYLNALARETGGNPDIGIFNRDTNRFWVYEGFDPAHGGFQLHEYQLDGTDNGLISRAQADLMNINFVTLIRR